MNTLQIYGILNKNISENSSFDGKYNSLTEQPQINGITLTGNKTLEDLGIIKTIKDVVGDITGTSSDCAPVGTIISYMGNIPPKGYLACDGKTYSITQYPELVKHFEETFENINFFGGDGTTTFAVPDLKGEFLRGSGANGHLASGNGANVGEHQDATTFPDIYFEQGDNNLAIRNNISAIGESNISNRDTNILGTVGKLSYINIPNHATVPTDTSGAVTSRPTNTSVLYCIKYQATYGADTDQSEVVLKSDITDIYPVVEERKILSGKKTSELIEKLDNQMLQNKEHFDMRLDNMISNSNDTPTGTIISFMGNTPPQNYLTCDGTIHNISDYEELAHFFENQFGSVSFFGGDGTTTFAVPDLRGEFLRGTGTAARNTGGGADVGLHQNATGHVRVECGAENILYIPGKGKNRVFKNSDKEYNLDSVIGRSTVQMQSGDTHTAQQEYYTSRPTNTSVLYCIKYQTTLRKTNRKYIINTDSLKVIAGDEICEVILNEYQLSTDGTVMINIPEIFLPYNFARGSGYVVADGKTYLAMCLINPENKNQIIFRYMFNNEYRTGREGDKVGGNLLWAYGK